ncbi:UNVERIFIED_CONTAM: hypothetical protein FKN15_000941 [Acipenser sinensis]
MACLLEAPLRISVLSEVTASSRHYVDRLFDPDPQKVLLGVIDMKNAVIGNNKQKANLIVLGAVPRLLYLLQQDSSGAELRTECAVVLGSLAMGTENNVKSLVDCHIIPALLQGAALPALSTGVQMQALKCFSVLAYENPQVSMTLVNVLVDGELLSQVFVRMMQRDKPIEMQLTAAKCLTYICRAGAIRTDDNCIVLKTLPCLVRMCSKERLLEERVDGAETLAYLIEPDVELQRIASITDHLIAMLADYFKYPSSVSAITDIKRSLNVIAAYTLPLSLQLDHDLKHAHELRQAAFKLYASLGANDEDIRKKIIETENMMDRIVSGLSESSIKVRLAAVRCLHSLSRSVQQLRTSFQDHAVWKPLMKLLQNAPEEVLVMASSTLCNLLLEFSPSKEPILESGAIDLLCSLTQSESPALRVNGIWALMNMAFQAEQKIKMDILRALSTEQLFRLLSDPDVNHIDQIMSSHGKQIMQAVTLILEGEHNVEVKEQTLCILANIADGTTAKDLIMINDDILQKIKYYMVSVCTGSQERQDRLREMGFVDILHKLTQSADPSLCDRAKTAMQQYLA